MLSSQSIGKSIAHQVSWLIILGYPMPSLYGICVFPYWSTYLAPAATNQPPNILGRLPCVRSGPHQPCGKTSFERPGLAGRRHDHFVSARFSKEVWRNYTGDHGEKWLVMVNLWCLQTLARVDNVCFLYVLITSTCNFLLVQRSLRKESRK